MSSGPLSFSGRFDARVELDRPQVDVLVQLEPHPEKDALLQDAGLDIGMADGAEVDGVHLLQLVEDRIGKDIPRLEVTLPAQVVVLQLILETKPVRSRLEGLEPFGHDLGTRPVAGDYRNLVHTVHTSVLECKDELS